MVGLREFAAGVGQRFDLLVVAAAEREALSPGFDSLADMGSADLIAEWGYP